MNLTWSEYLIISLIVVILSWLGLALWEDSKRPIFVLKKDEWVCAKTKSISTITPVIVGKVIITMPPTTTEECVEYRRKG